MAMIDSTDVMNFIRAFYFEFLIEAIVVSLCATVERWPSLTDRGVSVPRQTTAPLIVLGSGYTGHVLHKMGSSQGRTIHATSRNPLNNLAGTPSEQRLLFDLEQPSTWLNIPAGADLIWCFPATPLEQVQAFARTLDAPLDVLSY